MKGIILAGGAGTRLYPTTIHTSKQLLPVYDKPMIYYPLSTLMLAGISEILIISTERDIYGFKELLGDGSHIGISLSYTIQKAPRGLAEAFIIGEEFIGDESISLILGDNIFYGSRLSAILEKGISTHKEGALIFGYHVSNPNNFGVVEFSQDGAVLSLEEKPQNPRSNYAIPGLYFYDNTVINITKNIKPSIRGELDITDINKEYLKQKKLKVELLGRGMAWLDTGTHEGLLEASNFVAIMQRRHGLYIACIEEIAYHKKFITKEQLIHLAQPMLKTEYGQYLMTLSGGETL